MNTLTAIRSAWRSLRANKLRSMLTMLGIIIGVAAVITMIAVGGGATQRVQEQMKSLGSNVMLVLPGSLSAAGVRQGAQTRSRFTEEDVQAIMAEIPEVQAAAPGSRTSDEVMQLLAGLHAGGITVVMVTHESDVAAWAQRRLVFRDGRIVEDALQVPRQPAGQPEGAAA